MNSITQRHESELAVMFADVEGSTKLFDQIGDAAAKARIDQCLSLMIDRIEQHHGKLVKTIGDEVMCWFQDAGSAAEGAVSIQNGLAAETSLMDRSPLRVRVGLHFGSVILESGDLFGDVVNVAARMADIAKGGQIIVTEQFADKVSSSGALTTQLFDRVKVKGKQKEINVYEIVWEPADQTIIKPPGISGTKETSVLQLTYQNKSMEISSQSSGFLIGRNSETDLTVNFTYASRIHVVIEFHRGKFMLVDRSTNGTYVREGKGRELYLRREEFPLTDQGTISLGSSIRKNPDHLIHYLCC